MIKLNLGPAIYNITNLNKKRHTFQPYDVGHMLLNDQQLPPRKDTYTHSSPRQRVVEGRPRNLYSLKRNFRSLNPQNK